MRARLGAIDLAFYASTFTLIFVLWLALYSATSYGQGGEAIKQLLHIGLGATLMVGLTFLDYQYWRKLTPLVYAFSFFSLIAVLIVGHSVNGAQRWVSLGGLGSFQPSELAKFSVILVLAELLGHRFSSSRLLAGLCAVGGLFLLILVQPDLGTALVLSLLSAILAYAAGLNGTLLFAIGGLGLATLPLVLKQYQKDRLMVFVNPDIDPTGIGYQLVQSQTAIGSGHFWGKGLFCGHMTQNGFVPENWTDFIFTVIGEELGFIGSLGVVILYAILFIMVVRTAYRCKDRYGSILCLGFAALLLLHAVINIAMTLDLAPVVGIPLPLGSFGGTAMLVNLAGLGIVGNVSLQNRLPEEPLNDHHDPKHPSLELVSCLGGLD